MKVPAKTTSLCLRETQVKEESGACRRGFAPQTRGGSAFPLTYQGLRSKHTASSPSFLACSRSAGEGWRVLPLRPIESNFQQLENYIVIDYFSL